MTKPASEKELNVIEKIKKLFAVAQRKTNNDGSSNEAEASAAMDMAQALLTKYNLDLHTIRDSDKNKPGGGSAVDGPRERTQINRSAMYRWQQSFWHDLAEANYCFHWTTTLREEHPKRPGKFRSVKRHVILGSAVNVAAVTVMGEYLTETLETLLPYPNTERLSKSAVSWREGCAERLIERIQAKMRDMKKKGVTSEGSSSTALAVRDLETAEYAANYDARYGKGAWSRHLVWEAEYRAGEADRIKKNQERWDAEDAALEAARAKETPKQKETREEKEARAAEREERKYRRERFREATRLDGNAYNAGRERAEKINLSDQLKGH